MTKKRIREARKLSFWFTLINLAVAWATHLDSLRVLAIFGAASGAFAFATLLPRFRRHRRPPRRVAPARKTWRYAVGQHCASSNPREHALCRDRMCCCPHHAAAKTLASTTPEEPPF